MSAASCDLAIWLASDRFLAVPVVLRPEMSSLGLLPLVAAAETAFVAAACLFKTASVRDSIVQRFLAPSTKASLIADIWRPASLKLSSCFRGLISPKFFDDSFDITSP